MATNHHNYESGKQETTRKETPQHIKNIDKTEKEVRNKTRVEINKLKSEEIATINKNLAEVTAKKNSLAQICAHPTNAPWTFATKKEKNFTDTLLQGIGSAIMLTPGAIETIIEKRKDLLVFAGLDNPTDRKTLAESVSQIAQEYIKNQGTIDTMPMMGVLLRMKEIYEKQPKPTIYASPHDMLIAFSKVTGTHIIDEKGNLDKEGLTAFMRRSETTLDNYINYFMTFIEENRLYNLKKQIEGETSTNAVTPSAETPAIGITPQGEKSAAIGIPAGTALITGVKNPENSALKATEAPKHETSNPETPNSPTTPTPETTQTHPAETTTPTPETNDKKTADEAAPENLKTGNGIIDFGLNILKGMIPASIFSWIIKFLKEGGWFNEKPEEIDVNENLTPEEKKDAMALLKTADDLDLNKHNLQGLLTSPDINLIRSVLKAKKANGQEISWEEYLSKISEEGINTLSDSSIKTPQQISEALIANVPTQAPDNSSKNNVPGNPITSPTSAPETPAAPQPSAPEPENPKPQPEARK